MQVFAASIQNSGLPALAAMIKSSFSITRPAAALFVFSVLYFGIMADACTFGMITGELMTLMGGNVIGICQAFGVSAMPAAVAMAVCQSADNRYFLMGQNQKKRCL